MKPVSKALLMKMLTRVVAIAILAKALSLALLWFLPGEGVNFTTVDSVQPAYGRYGFGVMLEHGGKEKRTTMSSKGSVSSSATIDELVLKGLYGNGNYGFVIIALKSAKNKTEVVAVGEAFHGYTLVSIESDGAIFDLRGKRYSVRIDEGGMPNTSAAEVAYAAPEAEQVQQQVSRSQIDSYSKNIDQVWKDIGIQEVKRGEQITGFKVIRIREGTPFAELGLRQGDVIVKVNNKPLDSYAAAMEIYQKIDRLDALELVVLRNNQEQEILYEIY